MNEELNTQLQPDNPVEVKNNIMPVNSQEYQAGAVVISDWESVNAQEQAARVRFFGAMAVPCLIFAAVFVFCMYNNFGGVTTPLWVASIIALIFVSVNRLGRNIRKESYFSAAVMMLISISNFLTGSDDIHALNIMMLFALTVHLVLLNFADTEKWSLGKHVGEMIVAVFASIGYLLRPVTEASAFFKANQKEEHKGRKGNGKQILLGVIITIPCLLILGALLSSADMVFENMLDSFFAGLIVPESFTGILFMSVFGFLASYCGLHYAWSRGDRITVADRRNSEPVIAITVTAPITVMYLIFSMIQIIYLFIGNFELPEGITYAEYAREGFFQLLAVCIINMLLVLAMKKYVRRNRVLDIILIVICVCTYIMIASSACRMIMYIEAYELTLLRVSVLFTLLALAFLMAGVVISIVNEGFRFFRYGLVVVCTVYILFAFSKPDSYIAKYNLSDVGSEKKTERGVDFYYISCLSTDAAPIIDEYIRKEGIDTVNEAYPAWLERYRMNNVPALENTKSIRKYNVSEHRAKALGWTKWEYHGTLFD